MKFYTVLTTEFALNDLQAGRIFYEKQASLLGDYFFDALLTDIESLYFYAGIHLQEYGYYKMLSKRFPYAIYYEILDDVARVIAVLDQNETLCIFMMRLTDDKTVWGGYQSLIILYRSTSSLKSYLSYRKWRVYSHLTLHECKLFTPYILKNTIFISSYLKMFSLMRVRVLPISRSMTSRSIFYLN